MSADLPTILLWWFTLFLMGIVVLPITARLFGAFADRGYAFSKILALLLLSYLSWFIPSLHIIKFSQEAIILILTILALVNGVIYLKNRPKPKFKDHESKIKSNEFLIHNSCFLVLFLEEFLFLAGLLFWSFVRGQEPSIHGLEKFMDFGFMNSILRSDYFPPKDLWLTPLTLNYYYFGHLSAAVLFKLTGIIPEVGYNLVLASIFGLALSAVFSLGFNLFYQFICHNPQPDKSQLKDKKLSIANYLSPAKFASRQTKGNQLSIKPAVIAGLIATFLVNLGGNLHTIYAFTKGYPNEKPVPFWDLSPFGWNPQTYWYPNATRFIPFTIHEFPIYSYVVADLHGHVLNIPFVLFTIAIVFAVFFSKKIQPIHIILLPLLIASLYMGNATDGLVYGGLSGLIILYKWRSEVKRKLSKEKIEISKLFINFKDFIVSRFSQSGNNPPEFLSRAESRDYILPYKFLISLAWLAVGFVLFSLPFSLNFKLFVKGIGVVPANGHSPIYMLFILWGLPIFFAISFTWFHFGENLKPKIKSLFRGETLVKLIAKLTGTAIEVKNNSKLYIVNYKLAPSDILVFLLLIVSFGLIIFPEFFYFHDIYPLHYRANTMFKLGYQAFIMFGIANAYILVRLLQSKKVGPLFLVFSFLFSVLVSIYPYFAIKSYYGNLKNYKTLNGMNWLQAQYPSDFEAINWIRKNIPGQPVILEGVGESYTDYARISAFTGLPTVIGWPVHEWLWRGTYDEAGKRVAEMQQLFETSDINLAKNMLQKYNVKYVFIGQLEKQKYPKLEEEKFGKLGKIIFNNGTTKIYELAL